MQDPEFERIGKRLIMEGLLSGNFGNMSVRYDGGFFITASGSFLDNPGELAEVSWLKGPGEGASSEYRVHQKIYEATAATAIVHAHPPVTVAASFTGDAINPIDSEGKMFLPSIPVVDGEPGTEVLAENVGAAAVLAPVVIARGHGTFACAETLEKAYLLTAITEHAAKVLYYRRSF
ncbi:fuculose phosphate aldolase [Methanomicrobiaceae archaeon CYW5]|uniref:class II aldolase/adducin family protein n=1 Tax=Methanovulcanius yangii TaxID=1789227 RepID=UPI0029CA2638|nr:class II aldolase/adducin family protein [Methanovulcanius yangii]MBT8507804.1 fuculose phosphate aldolase [Methanovulcanius yangii]